MTEQPVQLDVSGVSKSFAGVAALTEVSLLVRAGEVHALIGENGAGKSTLINVISGVFAADAGQLRWRGEALTFASPKDAARSGVAVVHQEPQLIASVTALDNLFIGARFPTRRFTPLIARDAMRRQARAACDALGVVLPLDALVAELSATQRTQLALVRCTMRAPELLILDEPTAALTSRDAQQLLAVVNTLRQRGTAVLYVSHRLDEVLQIADRITVLRYGRSVATLNAAGQTQASLVELMSGQRASEPLAAPAPPTRGAVLLQASGLCSTDGRVHAVSLSLHAGELLGLYGMAGSGRSELLEMLVGLRPRASGELGVGGLAVGRSSPRDAARRGMVLIPEDRRHHALVLAMRVRENLSLPYLRRFARGGWLNRKRERAHAVDAMRAMDIKATGPEQTVAELSGGNQQKLVFARALAMQPTLLLCDEPTQAVDVGTRRAIHQLLRRHCDDGGAALVVSSDLDEMLALADRIVVLREGRSVTTLNGPGLSAQDVLHWCFAAAPEAAAA